MTILGAPLGARLASGHQGSDSARVGPILPWKPRVSVSHNSAMCSPSPLCQCVLCCSRPCARALRDPYLPVKHLGELGNTLDDQLFRRQGITQSEIMVRRVWVSGPFRSVIKGNPLLERWR